MQRSQAITALVTGLSITFACDRAHADDLVNTVKIGFAAQRFHTESQELAGEGPAAAFTPPGILVDLRNNNFLAVSYERRLSDRWSVLFQAGIPPLLKIDGGGSVAGVGTVGTARLWTPSLLATYAFDSFAGMRPYVGAGVNYVFFTNKEVRPVYTSAFGGTSSTLKLKSSWGPTVKLGLEYPITENWIVDLSYYHYWVKTRNTFTTVTPTPAGNVELVRSGDVRADPDIFGLVVGYRF